MKVLQKVVKIVVALLLVGGLAGGGWYYYNWTQKEPPLSEQYQTDLVIRADVAQTVQATGYTGTKESVSLYMTRTEMVADVWVKEGDPVKAGDVLITFDIVQDRVELERKRDQAQLNLDNAVLGLKLIGQPAQGNELLQYESDLKAAEKSVFDAENDIKSTEIRIAQQQRKLDDAQKAVEKNAGLLAAGALTQIEYDYSVTTYRNAFESMDDLRLQLEIKERTLTLRLTQQEEAAQRLDNAKNKLSEQANAIKYKQQENLIRLNEIELAQIEDDLEKLVEQIVSPVDGYVESVHVLKGGTAAKGNVLVRLADLSQQLVRADISEYDAPLLAEGQGVQITVGSLPDRYYDGTVTKIAARAVEKEKSSGTERVVPVEMTVHNADSALKTGYSVDIVFYIALSSQVLSVPNTAILVEADKLYVYVLDEDVLEKREITAGLRGDKRTEVLSGVSAEEAVVLNQAEIKTAHRG